MGILDRLEGAVGQLVEGLFRRDARGSLQPIDIGRHLIRAMESQKRVSISKTYVPNSYQVYLDPQQISDIRPMQKTLSSELRDFLEQKAEEEDLSFIGTLTIDFLESVEPDQGRLTVTALFEETAMITDDTQEETPVHSPQGGTMVFRAASKHKDRGEAQLDAVLIVGEDPEQVVWLHDSFRLGRSADCDLSVEDPNASRVHAYLRQNEDEWLLEDNHSTNGTYVNGERIQSETIQPGDTIQIGMTKLRFDRRTES